MKNKRALTLGMTLLLVASFALAGIASADIELLAPLHAWDHDAARFENGNATLWFDPLVWVSFFEQLSFDSDAFDTGPYDTYVPPADQCPAGDKLTPYAGVVEIGLYHTDNNPAGAQGFQETRGWALVDCDRNGDGLVNGDDLSLAPPTAWTPVTGVVLAQVGTADEVLADYCGGNCADEIVNRFFVNLDPDCDGTANVNVPTDRVCLYWEAQPPDTTAPDYIAWVGNFQARINDGGGDKTLNFKLYGPTAVAVRSFQASAVAPLGLALAAALGGLGAAGLMLRRRTR